MVFFHIVFVSHPTNIASAGGFQESFGSVVALPAVTEKGLVDVHLEVTSPGGHSSTPPKHTVRPGTHIIGTSIILCPEYWALGRLYHRD